MNFHFQLNSPIEVNDLSFFFYWQFNSPIEVNDLFFFFLIFIGILLIYNVVLLSGVQQSEFVIHIHIYTF